MRSLVPVQPLEPEPRRGRPEMGQNGTSALGAGWLSELVLHLYQIQSAVVVSAAALRRQNCELDDDIANVLQRSVADRLQDQIERAEGALQRLGQSPNA
jgi:hypothetical protein